MAKKQYIWHGINLEDQRLIMDEPADEAVASIFKSHSMKHLVGMLKDMAKNDDFVSNELPPSMHEFVEQELSLTFTDKDIEYFNQTHKIWEEHGMKFIFILFFRSLPFTYRAEKPANVLRMTKLLVDHAERRIFETAQFVFDVMDEQWWTPEKRGILTATKVRIMHAGMRHIILDDNHTNEQWNSEWGKPISQEDLIATNQVFSLEFFKGLELLGDELTPKEQTAWFHTWKTIAKIMGVKDDLISKDVKEAWTLQHTIYDHLFRGDSYSGIVLAKALVHTMDKFHLPTKLTLMIMKRMLADERFPDSFEKMLGPSFEKEYPELFEVHETKENKDAHDKKLRSHFHKELKGYHSTLKEKNGSKQHIGWFQKIFDFFMNLFGVSKKDQQLIDIHLAMIHNILHHRDTGNPIEEFEEHMIIDSMSALGGIMISILNVHYREGKDTGFRIPKTLQANWKLKG